jgi:hypothetical protein
MNHDEAPFRLEKIRTGPQPLLQASFRQQMRRSATRFRGRSRAAFRKEWRVGHHDVRDLAAETGVTALARRREDIRFDDLAAPQPVQFHIAAA